MGNASYDEDDAMCFLAMTGSSGRLSWHIPAQNRSQERHTLGALAAERATTTVRIIFPIVGDPVADGLVAY